MTQVTRTQFALMLHSVPRLGPKGIARLLSELPPGLPDENLNLSDIKAWNLSADSLQKEYKLHHEAAHSLTLQKEHILAFGTEAADAVDRLGIRVITMLDPDYPSQLKEYGHDLPPVVYAYGNMSLLREKKYAVVSSANTGAQGIETLRSFAGILADQGLTTITSHNTHPYQITGLAAKSRNAPVILVLDRGILSAFPQGLDWEPVAQARIWNVRFDAERDLVISRFRLYDPWIGANGRERDRMVFALADVLVAVEIRPGGVMEAECLRAQSQGREVFVFEGQHGGNRTLLGHGCSPISITSAKSVLTTLDLPMETSDDLP